MFNYDEWVNNHEHIYNMKGAVWQDQKAFGRIAVEAALKNAESATTGLQQLQAAIALLIQWMDHPDQDLLLADTDRFVRSVTQRAAV